MYFIPSNTVVKTDWAIQKPVKVLGAKIGYGSEVCIRAIPSFEAQITYIYMTPLDPDQTPHFTRAEPNNNSLVDSNNFLSLHQGNTESRKTLAQKFIFQIGTLNPNGINERFSFN